MVSRKLIISVILLCILAVAVFTGCSSTDKETSKTAEEQAALDKKKQEEEKDKKLKQQQEEALAYLRKQLEKEKAVIVPEEQIPSLAEVYKDYFTIGGGILVSDLDTKGDMIKKHYASITCGNEMKWDATNPSEGVYTFDRADKIVDFAVKNNMKVRSHTLVWHSQCPKWVFEDKNGSPVSKDILLKRMEEHIKTEVGRYKGKVYCWDVVNEALSDNNSETFRRDSSWYKIAGEDFIKKAFQYAHEADPDAELYYNDYNLEQQGKRERAYKMIKSMLDQGVPIHGIGLQGHYDIYNPSINDIKATIDLFAGLGLKVQITELDMSVYGWGDSAFFFDPPQERLNTQARRYRELFELLRSYKDKGIITGVTLWGIDDKKTWLDNFPVVGRKNWPLLFDENSQPKKAFWEITDFAKK